MTILIRSGIFYNFGDRYICNWCRRYIDYGTTGTVLVRQRTFLCGKRVWCFVIETRPTDYVLIKE